MNAKSLAQIFNIKQQVTPRNGVTTLSTVNGVTRMSRNPLKSFAEDAVSNYATFDKCLKQYTIEVDDLSDFTQHEFAALIMIQEDGYATEANGPDNIAYEKTMLPALLRFLKNTTDRDEEIEFVNAWRDGVTSYLKPSMEKLLEDAVYEYNADRDLLYTEEPVSRDKPDREVNIWS